MALTTQQTNFVTRLLAGEKLVDIAVALKIGERTAQRWRALPEVEQELQAGRQRLLDEAHDLLFSDLRLASEALRGLLNSANAGIRLRASLALLDLAGQRIVTDELARRLEALERGDEDESESDQSTN